MFKGISMPGNLIPTDCHHIVTYRSILGNASGIKIILGGLADAPLLLQRDCFRRIPRFFTSAVFHFHKNQITALPHDQINLASAAVKVALHNPGTLALQIFCCHLLVAFSHCPFVQSFPPLLALILSMASTKTRISATTSYNSGGIISPISKRDRVSASLSSL